MVEVVFRRDSRNRLSSVFAGGHAGWAQSGSDVVCAAVSAILQTTRLGLEAHAGVALEAKQSKGEMAFSWPEPARDDAAVVAIVRSAELAIEQVAAQYPEHVTFRQEVET
jgi:hypothetical protein